MDVRITRRGVPTGILWGALGIMAWAAITVVTGGGAAHADESDDGLLSPVTSLVSDTLSTATAPVAPVVTQVVAPAVQTVVVPVQPVAPAVVAPVVEVVTHTPAVGPTTAPIVETAGDTVDAVVTPVTEVLGDAPVATVTAPVVDAVADLPVVGELLDDAGVIDLVGTVVDAVDDAVAVIGDTADETVEPVTEAVDPGDAVVTPPTATDPGTPSDIVGSELSAFAVATTDSALSPSTSARTLDVDRVSDASSAIGTLVRAGVSDAARDSSPSSGFLPGLSAPASSSAGSGGASSSAGARLDGVGLPPLPTWSRVSGASDDVLPSSTVADTDVSPD